MSPHEDASRVVSAKGLTHGQLASLEEKAARRYRQMRTNNPNAGNISLALAALLIEWADATSKQDTQMFVVSKDDIKPILKSYFRRWKLSKFPYKNGERLDFVEHADLSRLNHPWFVG
jgi:hypothetical protein